MLSLKESMELAGDNLVHTLAPSHDYLPFWNVRIEADMTAQSHMSWASHNVGRWWDAMLRLEHATGYVIPAWAESTMMRNAERTLGGPLGVCGFVNSTHPGSPDGWIDVHSQREMLLTLACLARYRGSRWAAQAGAKMVRALDRYIVGDDYDFDIMLRICRKAGMHPVHNDPRHRANPTSVTSHGRMIEGLLEFYRATGDDVAMTLADRLARLHFDMTTREDGTPPSDKPGYLHTHSYLGTLKGLLMLGELTRQRKYVERVAQTYRVTVRKYVLESGFISHDFMTQKRGETTSPGDAAQIALWLARLGYEEFLDDVERIVRARMLPSQITGPIGLKPKAADGSDEQSKLEERCIGAYGGMHDHPHGQIQPTTDITAACLHTLCDIYANVAERTPSGPRINFHLDYRDDGVTVTSTRGSGPTARARVQVDQRTAQNTWIRVPSWAPPKSVALSVNGKKAPLTMIGRYAFAPAQAAPSRIVMTYALPTHKSSEKLDKVTYRFAWKGDEITGVRPNAAYLPFHPTLRR